MSDELHDILIRWEGAVSAVERDGDDSEAALKELADSRAALLAVLRRALDRADRASRAEGYRLEDATRGTGEMGQ